MSLTAERTISEFVDSVGKYLVRALEPTLRTTLEMEIGKALDKSLRDGEFYKCISEDLQQGVSELFRQISNFKKEAGEDGPLQPPDPDKAEKMLSEASSQLDYIFKSTEEAATNILNIIEKNMAVQDEVLTLLEKEGSGSGSGSGSENIQRLKGINRDVQNDYIQVMTALSFQDLTGQRITKVLELLSHIEKSVLRMLVSTGIKMKEKEASPDKDLNEIFSEAQVRLDTALKGPQACANQVDIDNLLGELGL